MARIRRETEIETLAGPIAGMNDRELKSILKSVPVPKRTPEYWDGFPSNVRVQLRTAPPAALPSRSFRSRLAWAGGLAFAGLFLFMALWSVHLVLKNEKTFRHELATLPQQLHVLMADEHGMHYLIADKE